jgi:peptidoglycan/LPS O-acetylase OafA/YrhL
MLPRIRIIEMLRGLAALSVVIFHVTGQMNEPVIRLMGAYGWLGVDVFFVISGFVIPYSLWGREYSLRKFPQYMMRRIVRLEPPYLASIALGVILWEISSRMPGFRGEMPTYSATQIGLHLFYLIPLSNEQWLSPVYWSLAYEFVFYIVVGLAFALLVRWNAVFIVVFCWAIVAAKYLIVKELDYHIQTFVIGILAMRLVVGVDDRRTWALWTSFCVLAIGVTAGLLPAFAVAFTVAIIIWFRNTELGRWATMVGAISYSLYLTHTLVAGRVVNLGKRYGDGLYFESGLTALSILVGLVFAFVFWWAVEAPAIKASRYVSRDKS